MAFVTMTTWAEPWHCGTRVEPGVTCRTRAQNVVPKNAFLLMLLLLLLLMVLLKGRKIAEYYWASCSMTLL